MKRKLSKIYLMSAIAAFSMACTNPQTNSADSTEIKEDQPKYVLVVHGGAGTLKKELMTPEKEKAYQEGLTEALQKGYEVIQAGGSSLDAAQAAVNVLEDNPLFNAARGAVFTNEGQNELDASIMDGKTLKAGAVAGVKIIKNPINAARAVMDQSEHVMMMGKGAELFAISQGCDTVPPSYFYTPERWEQLQRALKKEKDGQSAYTEQEIRDSRIAGLSNIDHKFGTVGAVALDQAGNLAAATSTGGMTNKRYGRVGDSPIIGAGTYANNATCGISSTGWGEFYIRTVAAHRVSNLMELKNLSITDAMQQTIREIGELGGDGGMIGLTKEGKVAMEFNTSGMYRGVVDDQGNIQVFIFKE